MENKYLKEFFKNFTKKDYDKLGITRQSAFYAIKGKTALKISNAIKIIIFSNGKMTLDKIYFSFLSKTNIKENDESI